MRRWGSSLVAGLALCGLAWLTARHVPVWTSDLALWRAATAADPTSARAWVNLGAQAQAQHRASEATDDYRQAIVWAEDAADNKGKAIALVNLALIAADMGQYPEARRLYHDAQGVWPDVHHKALERAFATLDLMEAR